MAEEFDVSVGQRIIQTAKLKDIPLNKIARKLGIEYSAISMWKKGGAPSVEKIASIAEILEVSVEFLITGKNQASLDKRVSESELEAAIKIAKLEGRLEEMEKQIQKYEAIIRDTVEQPAPEKKEELVLYHNCLFPLLFTLILK